MQLLSRTCSTSLPLPLYSTRKLRTATPLKPLQRCTPIPSYGCGRDPVISDDSSPAAVSCNTPLAKARMAASISLAKDFAAVNGISFLLSAYARHMGLIDDSIAAKFALLSFDMALMLFIWRVANMSIFDPGHTQQCPGGATYLHYYSAFDLDTAKEVDKELHSLRMELLKKDAAILYLQRFLNDDKK